MPVPEEREFAFLNTSVTNELTAIDTIQGSNAVPTQTDDLPFSRVKGYRLKDFETHCSVDPERSCPAKVQLVSDYTRGISKRSFQEAVGIDDRSPEEIRRIITTKLREYSIWAPRAEYANAGSSQCPTREMMDASEVRKTGVNIFRSLKMAIARVRS